MPRLLAVPAVLVCSLALAGPASASVSVTTTATTVEVTSAGTADKPTISLTGGNVVVSDAFAASGGCTLDANAHTATCPAPSGAINVAVGGNNDFVTVDGSVTLPTSVTLGAGEDVVALAGTGNDTANAGQNFDPADQDAVVYSGRSGPMTINLATGVAGPTGGGEQDTLVGFHNVIGTPGDDVITADA